MASIKDNKRPAAERRVFNLTDCEVRKETRDDGSDVNVFSGYAAVFNELSVNLGGFREVIRPGCFRDAVDEGQDVRFLFNHDANMILGRTASGTVTLVEDETGLRVDCTLGNQTYAQDLAESMLRGDVSGMSFGFVTREDAWREKDSETGLPIRELLRADLFDVSAVVYPAYPDTSAELRAEMAEMPETLLARAVEAAAELSDTPADPTPAEPAEDTAAATITIPEGMSDEQARELMVRWIDEHKPVDERAGKTLSSKNKETLTAAADLLAEVLASAAEAKADAVEIVELNSHVEIDGVAMPILPDLETFRAAVEKAKAEGRGWGYEDDWNVWSLTSMIEAASCFLLYADDENESGELPQAAAQMTTIMEQLATLLAAVIAARDGKPAGEQRDETETDTPETQARFDRERLRLTLAEHELAVL